MNAVLETPRIIYAGRFQGRGSVPAHAHEGDEVVLVRRGEASCEVAGRHLPGPTRSLWFLPRGRVQCQSSREQVETAFVIFRFDRYRLEKPRQLQPDVSDPVLRWLEDVVEEYQEGGPAAYPLLDAVLARLASHWVADDVPAIVRDAQWLLREELSAPVADIAARVGLSVGQLERLFRRHTGMTPKQYQVRERVKHACELLRKTNRSIKAIAFDCGYSNADYFIRHFTRTQGLSPTRWRAKETRALAR